MRLYRSRLLRRFMVVVMLLVALAPSGTRMLAAANGPGDWQMVCTSTGMRWVPANANPQDISDSGTRSSNEDRTALDADDCPLCIIRHHAGHVTPTVQAVPMATPLLFYREIVFLEAAGLVFRGKLAYFLSPPAHAPPPAQPPAPFVS